MQSIRAQVHRNPSQSRLPDKSLLGPSNKGNKGNMGLPKVESMVSLNRGNRQHKLPQIKQKPQGKVARTYLERREINVGHYPHADSPEGVQSFGYKSKTKSRSVEKTYKKVYEKEANQSNLYEEESHLKRQDTEGEGLPEEFLDKYESVRNAKSYKIEDLGQTNDSFKESTKPVSHIKNLLQVLGGVFTFKNLSECEVEANAILEQPYEYIRKTKALREVSLLILAMIKFDLITEEVAFLNAIAVLFQSFEQVVREDPTPKYVNRVFDTLQAVLGRDNAASPQVVYQLADFLNNLGDRVLELPQQVQVVFLVRAFEILGLAINRLFALAHSEGVAVNQFLRLTETHCWLFLSRIVEDAPTKELLLSDEELIRGLNLFVENMAGLATNFKETDFMNLKEASVACDIFGAVFAVVKDQEVGNRLAEVCQNETLNVGVLVEFLLSSVIQVLYNGFLTERIEDKLERVLRLAQRTVSHAKNLDVEMIVHLFCRIFCEKSFEMWASRQMTLSTELVLLLKEVAFACRDVFIRLFKHNRRNLDSVVYLFNTACPGGNRRDYQRQKEQFLRHLVETIGLLNQKTN